MIGLVSQVKEVTCRFDTIAGREFPGKVTKIGREASQTTRTFPVTVEIEQPEDARILPGMAAMVRHNVGAGEELASMTLIVPPSSVFTTAEGPQTFVWIFDAETLLTNQML